MIRRGAAVLVALAVVLGAVLYLDRPYTGYWARVTMADAGGLQNGSNVTVNGVAVGSVASLEINRADRAVAVVHLDKSAVPLGSGASATVQIDGFFGERELLLNRGDYRQHPERSGYTVPVGSSSVSVRLDDVLNSIDPDAQGALRTFLEEQGKALVGRGGDLAAVLAQLPQTLPSLTQLLSQLSSNQHALGELVDRSDRVVAQVAGRRNDLGQMVNSAEGALSALASRRPQLGQTVQSAPATLQQARATLATLQGAAIPLAPAADGLRATAPSLTAALREIPQFANASVPTLNEVATVSPALQRLADQATPVVHNLVPLTAQLTGYAQHSLAPLTGMLADRGGAASLFGVMEGWARSTQGYDASSHIFRFGATLSADSFKQLLSMIGVPGLPPLARASRHARAPQRVLAAAPAAHAPAHGPAGAGLGAALGKTVAGALGALPKTGIPAVDGATAAVSKLASGAAGAAGSQTQSLLDYLLRP